MTANEALQAMDALINSILSLNLPEEREWVLCKQAVVGSDEWFQLLKGFVSAMKKHAVTNSQKNIEEFSAGVLDDKKPADLRGALEIDSAATGLDDVPTVNARREFIGPILRKKGMSIHDWAKQAKVDFHTANDYLKGKSNPYPNTIKKLAAPLGIEPEKLPK